MYLAAWAVQVNFPSQAMNDRSKPAFRGPTAGMPMARWQFDINEKKQLPQRIGKLRSKH
jgi:Holliday junction DNA helicase RuvB